MKIFLGGTCRKSKWRDKLIPLLTMDYFDPRVRDWTPECVVNENKEKDLCDIILYVITRRDSVYSIAEVVDDSNKRPHKTIFCLYDEDNNFNEADRRSLSNIADMIKRNGSEIYYVQNMEALARYLYK